jgi:guanosine-3',5'-bis(diphosphate) 3'-pyrophosphohydrolase
MNKASIPEHSPIPGSNLSMAAVLLSATHFAALKHRCQRRKNTDADPYINHPIAVANLLAGFAGVTNLPVLQAALLHDTIEDTETTPQEVEQLFGREVLMIVKEVTDDKSLPQAERKRLQIEHASHLSHSAKLIKLADKISNLRELTDRDPAEWPLQRKREYLEWAEKVVAGLRGSHSDLERLFDQTVQEKRALLKS